jgi:hypothetical protein
MPGKRDQRRSVRTQHAMRSGEVQRPRDRHSGDPPDLEAMRTEVERRMVRGDRFSDVEDVINAAALSADEKSALWLLAWSYVNWRAQRREARAHLATLAPRQPARPPVGRHRVLRPVT